MKMELTARGQNILGVVSITVFVLFSLCALVFIGIPIVKTASNPEEFRRWIDSMGVWGKLGYVGICFLQVLVAIIPGGPIELAGGYAFGHVEATVLSTIGLGLGSVTVFLLVRKFGRSLLEVFFKKEQIEELKFLKTNRRRDIIILILFLAPGTPKDLLCFYCGLTDMPFLLFFLISTFARLPAAWLSSIGGSAMNSKSYTIAIIAAVVIVSMTVLGIVGYRVVVKRHREEREWGRERDLGWLPCS